MPGTTFGRKVIVSSTAIFSFSRIATVASQKDINMSRSSIGDRKILEAKKILAEQQKQDRAAEQKAQKAAQKAQTTKRGIAGNLRGPILHKTAFQRDLQAAPDYYVPAKLTKIKPAVSTTTKSQGR
jgi:hypothetical protein